MKNGELTTALKLGIIGYEYNAKATHYRHLPFVLGII